MSFITRGTRPGSVDLETNGTPFTFLCCNFFFQNITRILVLVKMIRAKKARKQKQVIHPLAKMIEDKYPKVAEVVKQADNYSSSDTSNDQIETLSDTKDPAEKSPESSPSQFKISKSSAAKSLQFNDSNGADSSSQDETVNHDS